MEDRLNYAISCFYYKNKKDLNFVLDAIQAIFDEEIDFEPGKYSDIMNTVLNTVFLTWEEKFFIFEHLIELGIEFDRPGYYGRVPCVESAIFQHDIFIINKLMQYGLRISGSNFTCLMTDDIHLDFVKKIFDILPMDNLSEYIRIVILCEAWKTFEFFLSKPKLILNGIGMEYHAQDRVTGLLLEKGEDKFLKYLPILCDRKFNIAKEGPGALWIAVEKNYFRSFELILTRIRMAKSKPVKIVWGIIYTIFQTRRWQFLLAFNKDEKDCIIRKYLDRMIKKKFFIGIKTLLDSVDIKESEYPFDNWLKMSYRPRSKKKMMIFNYLKNLKKP